MFFKMQKGLTVCKTGAIISPFEREKQTTVLNRQATGQIWSLQLVTYWSQNVSN